MVKYVESETREFPGRPVEPDRRRMRPRGILNWSETSEEITPIKNEIANYLRNLLPLAQRKISGSRPLPRYPVLDEVSPGEMVPRRRAGGFGFLPLGPRPPPNS